MKIPIVLTTDVYGDAGPAYATSGSAGMDLRAAIPVAIELDPGKRIAVPTGIHMSIHDGYEGQVRSRSGLAINKGVFVINSPGTVDSDYTGEVKVLLVNLGQWTVTINPGDRIAQLVICPVTRAEWLRVDSLDATVRGSSGLGSTGT